MWTLLAVMLFATPENPGGLIMDCTTHTEQTCSDDEPCAVDVIVWRTLYVMDPAKDGANILKRVMVENPLKGTKVSDSTTYELQAPDKDTDGMLHFLGHSGAAATDLLVIGPGGGFTAVKSSLGVFTTRMGSCEAERVQPGRMASAVAARWTRSRPAK